MNRNQWMVLLGIGVALIATYLALKDVDIEQLRLALTSAHYGYVLPSLVLTLCGYLARTWRWQALIAPIKRVSFKNIFSLLVIGFAWNVVVPLRVGEVVRAHLLGKREQLTLSMLLATIVVERVLDGVAIMALLGLVAWLHPSLPLWALDFSYAALGIFGVALAGLTILLVSEAWALRLLALFTRFMPAKLGRWLNNFAQTFMKGFVALRSPTGLWQVTLSTVAIWLVEAASYAVLFPAFDFAFDALTFSSAASFYAVVLNLSTLIPSAPGNVGTLQYFGKLALSVFAVPAATALSFTVVAHAVQLATIVGLGLWALWREGFSLRELAPQPEN